MPKNKKLAICVASFLVILGLGLLWAISVPTEFTGGQRLLISAVLGLFAAGVLFYLLSQAATLIQDRTLCGTSLRPK